MEMPYSVVGLGCLLVILSARAADANCVCYTVTGNLNIRSGPGTDKSRFATLRPGHILRGGKSPPTSNNGYVWYNVIYSGKDAWAASNWLKRNVCPCESTKASECPNIVSRAEWKAAPPKGRSRMPSQAAMVFIHHTAGRACTTKAACINQVKGIQNYHMNSRGWADIGYSFLVGEDGNAYEGRGWGIVGAHTKDYNRVGIAISFLGNFMTREPNPKAIQAAKQLIRCGVKLGQIKSTYQLLGHRDVARTLCPGDKLYSLMKTWKL